MQNSSVIRKTMVLTASLMLCLLTFSGEGMGQCKSGIYKLQDGRNVEVVQGSRGSEAFLLGVGQKDRKPLPDGSYLIGGDAKLEIRAGIATLQNAGSSAFGKGTLINKAGKPGDKRGTSAMGPKHDELLTNPANEGGGKGSDGVGGKAGKITGKRGSEAIGPKHDELLTNSASEGGGKGSDGIGGKAGKKIIGKRGSEAIGPKHDELTPNPESDSGGKGPGAIGGKAGKIRGKRGSEAIGPKHDELTPNPESDSGGKIPGAAGGGTK